ncbi:uncharacterized protein LOC114973334 [Acropora millepora]|uniref:uncharacterized protein LOC114973334 n=1 Tax=Acropora millepora TaxID=45264 RepID=UPI001CF1DF25|nr:uncharacterized protein LOC114973334 [Acropora millepora]
MWEDQRMKFDGIPYFVLGQKIYDCRNGKDRKKAWKQKRKEMKQKEGDHHYTKRTKKMVQDTKKMGCPAQVIVREIMKFPQFQISTDSPKRRRKASERLREYFLEQKDLTGERRFYIELPEVKDHVMKNLHSKHDAADDQTTHITNLEMPVCPSDITENGHIILPLPTKQKTSRTQATKCREVLNHLRNLTFLVHEEEPLTALQATLSSALLELQQFVPTEDGIALDNKDSHQEDQQKSFPPSSTTKAKANPLPQRKEKRNKYSGRVGEKAGTMKKTYNVSFIPELAEPSKAHVPYSHAGQPVRPPQSYPNCRRRQPQSACSKENAN